MPANFMKFHQSSMEFHEIIAYTPLIVLDPELPSTLPEMKGIMGTDGASYMVIK